MELPTAPKVTAGVHCHKLRTKSMYINATVDSAAVTLYDPYETSAYWCVLTQTALGPDRQPVRPDACREDRDCCML